MRSPDKRRRQPGDVERLARQADVETFVEISVRDRAGAHADAGRGEALQEVAPASRCERMPVGGIGRYVSAAARGLTDGGRNCREHGTMRRSRDQCLTI